MIADIHNSSKEDQPEWTIYDVTPEYRRFSTAQTRSVAAATAWQSGSVDLAVQLGDALDAGETNGQPSADRVAEVWSWLSGNYTKGPIFNVVGNHEHLGMLGEENRILYASQLDGGAGDGRITIFEPDDYWLLTGIWPAYYLDHRGIRYIVISNPAGSGTLSMMAGQLEALDGWLDTDLPVVIFSHGWLSGYWPFGYYNYGHGDDAAEGRAVLENHDNVQAVFQGHHHRGPDVYQLCVKIKGIPYYHIPGSVLAPGESDNHYFIVEIEPHAYGTPYGPKANIKITGYGKGTRYSQEMQKFIPC